MNIVVSLETFPKKIDESPNQMRAIMRFLARISLDTFGNFRNLL